MKTIDLNIYEPYRIENEKLHRLYAKRTETAEQIRRLETARFTESPKQNLSVDEILESDNPGAFVQEKSRRQEVIEELAAMRRTAALVEQAIEKQRHAVEEQKYPASSLVVEQQIKPLMEPILEEIRRHGKALIAAFARREELLDKYELADGAVSRLPENYRKTSLEYWLGKIDNDGGKSDAFLKQVGA